MTMLYKVCEAQTCENFRNALTKSSNPQAKGSSKERASPRAGATASDRFGVWEMAASRRKG